MEYNRRPKPFHQKKLKVRRKENRMQRAREQEFQLPSSNRGNRKDFFKGVKGTPLFCTNEIKYFFHKWVNSMEHSFVNGF
jgi:hypothetical protein